MSQYFPKPYEPFWQDISIKVGLSNYATDLKNATGIGTSKQAAKSDLVSLKADVDKLDIDKLIHVPVDLNKLSDVVLNDVVKKSVYDKLVAKVNNIDTTGFALKTKYDTDKLDLEKKISDTSLLVKKLDYNAKITKLENKIPSISGLVTNTVLTEVENEIPNISGLVQKKRKKIITQKLLKLKRNLLIIMTINILLLENLVSLQQKFLIQD